MSSLEEFKNKKINDNEIKEDLSPLLDVKTQYFEKETNISTLNLKKLIIQIIKYK